MRRAGEVGRVLVAAGLVIALGACTHHGGTAPPSLTPVGVSLASSAIGQLDPNRVSFAAPAARSVELVIVDPIPVTRLDLDGVDQLLISGVTSATGPDGAVLPPGAITALGHIVLDGSFTLAGTVVVQPAATHLSQAMIVASPGALHLSADDIAINATTTGLTSVTAEATGEIRAQGDDVVMPQAIPIPSTRVSSISWGGGGGQLHAGDVPFVADHLGAIGKITASATPSEGVIAVAGSGSATQLWADGRPLLATKASIDRIRTDVEVVAGDPNSSTYVTWAPRNTGAIDMAMTAVHVQEGPGDWVNLELRALPAMFGGEAVPAIGGDSTGLGDRGRGGLFGSDHASAIRSYLGPKDADRRDLSLDVPDNTPPGDYRIVLRIEGNFDPVTFDATIHVRAPG